LNSKIEDDIVKVDNNSKDDISDDSIFLSDYYDASEIIEVNYLGISRYGIKDEDGNWIIQPMFDSVRNGYDEWGYCIVQLNGKWGLIKGNFSWVLDPIYEDLDGFWGILYSPDCYAKINGKWGLIQTDINTGYWKIKPNFDSITTFQINSHKCSLNGKYGVIDEYENWIIKPEFQDIISPYGDIEVIAAKLNEKWGFINIKADWLIEPKYDAIRNSEDFWSFIIRPGGGFGNNNYCIVQYKEKWGFIDKNDKWIVEPIFDFLQNEFNEKGYCLGRLNNETVGIDKLGNIYNNPNQDFDSQLLIEDENDFDANDSKTDSFSNESQSDINDNQKATTSIYNINDLNNLIGLKSVKGEIISLHNFINVQKKRGMHGLRTSPISHHCVFTGSPGTGKTTVARIIASIYKEIGLLNKGHLVETDRSGLVAEYLGQTAAKVNRVFDSALDGILFIDEAYSLVGENQDDFGKEAVSTLIKRMEDDRNRIIVILAGYKGEMEKFINTNPGLQSRFNRYIHFDDYNPQDLMEIFKKYCNDEEYHLSSEAENSLHQIFEKEFKNKNKNFGNGRFVRNIFEKVINKQADRIIDLELNTKDDFKIIENIDVLNLDS
jgi:AAA+ superfamily predicted ATPase